MRYLPLLLLLIAGCAQVAADEIDDRGRAAAQAGLAALDKPPESAAPPAEVGPQTPPPPDSEPVKYMPPPDQVRRVLLFTDTSWCTPCRREAPELDTLERDGMKIGKSEGMDVKIIEAKEQTRGVQHADWHRQFNITALPTFVLLVDGVETDRKVGFLTAAQIREFYGSVAPEVATQRPFADPWRQELMRKHGRQAVSAHTNLDAETVALPTTVLHLKEQSVQFSDSRESRLNRWFSVSFGAGTVSHNGSTVEFSNPPELRFHLFESGRGEVLDSLKAIEFVSGGAKLHLTRFGSINFRVK